MIKSKGIEIRNEIFEIRQKILVAQNRFNNTIEPHLINSYIYEIKSLNERYSYLIDKSKTVV